MQKRSKSQTGASFWEIVKDVADEWERAGWLYKYQDENGMIWWGLTPLGRKRLNSPTLPHQIQ
jgi:hypothetical protein